MRLALIPAILALTGCSAASESPWTKPQPDAATYPASMVRVIDGDSFEITGERIRLKGWDTPEHGRHAKCDQEKAWAKLATDKALEIVRDAETVSLIRTGRDRYGRTLAHIAVNGSTDYGEAMLADGMAQRWNYDAGQRKPSWCGQ